MSAPRAPRGVASAVLETLEFPAALERVAAHAVGPLGAARVRGRTPVADPDMIRAALAQVAELDGLGRLHEHGGARGRLVVHDGADLGAGGAAHRDDVETAPHGDGRVGGAFRRIERAEDGLEPLHQPLARLAHGAAGAGDAARRAVEHLPFGVEGLGQPRLELSRR